MADHIKLSNGLTPKQNQLKTEVLKQITEQGKVNMTKVGLKVFDTDNPESARVMATQALQNPTIQEQIQESLNRVGLTPDVITNNLKFLAIQTPDKVSADVMLKANVELLKLYNAYPGKQSLNLNLSLKGKIKDLTPKQAQEELEKLNSKLGNIESDVA